MYRFIESIRLENGVIPWLEWHQQRVDLTLSSFKASTRVDLAVALASVQLPTRGVYKIRVLYSLAGLEKVEQSPYMVRNINTVKLIPLPEGQEYSFKYEDRSWLTELLNLAGTDDILLHKGEEILDASYANLVFLFENQWFTPEVPLLRGTCRARLLAEGKIQRRKIRIEDLQHCTELRWINAMIPWDEAPVMHQERIQALITI